MRMVADIGMPGMDGLHSIRAVRQMPGPAQSMPAAALTAYARSQDRITSLASGYQMHLCKADRQAELVVAVSVLANRTLKPNALSEPLNHLDLGGAEDGPTAKL